MIKVVLHQLKSITLTSVMIKKSRKYLRKMSLKKYHLSIMPQILKIRREKQRRDHKEREEQP